MEQWVGAWGREGRKHPVNLCRVECECAVESGGLGQLQGYLAQSSRSIGQVSRNVVSKMTANTTKVNAIRAKTSRATKKTSLVVLLVLCLLTEGYAKTTLSLPTRFLDRDRRNG